VKDFLIKIDFWLKLIGFSPYKFIRFFGGLWFYFRDFLLLKKQLRSGSDFAIGKLYPVLDERYSESGEMKGHYFHQDLLVARRIFETNPARHIDIGSRIDGFVAHVAAFRGIEVFDIRPQKSMVRNIIFRQADLMKLPDDMKECCDSISSLHAIEHFGLGRYGDQIDRYGHIKAIENISSMLRPGGKFYFSVPIGRQRIEFNAHRVFGIRYLLDLLTVNYDLVKFHYVNDAGNLIENATLSEESVSVDFGCKYGCGIFELVKK
jgi:hypothetical protein